MLLDKDLLVEWRVEEMREMEGEEDRWMEKEKASNKRNLEDEDIAVFTVRATIGHQAGLLPAD